MSLLGNLRDKVNSYLVLNAFLEGRSALKLGLFPNAQLEMLSSLSAEHAVRRQRVAVVRAQLHRPRGKHQL